MAKRESLPEDKFADWSSEQLSAGIGATIGAIARLREVHSIWGEAASGQLTQKTEPATRVLEARLAEMSATLDSRREEASRNSSSKGKRWFTFWRAR